MQPLLAMRAARWKSWRHEQANTDGAARFRERRSGRRCVRRQIFPPPGGLEPQVLEIGERDTGHERVSVQACPGTSLEVIESEFLFELLVRLLAHPAR